LLGPAGVRAQTEREICEQICQLDALARVDPCSHLLAVSRWAITRRWPAQSLQNCTQVPLDRVLAVAGVLAEIFDADTACRVSESAFLIGSPLYMAVCDPQADLDVAISCDSATALQLRRGIARLRRTRADRLPRDDYFSFALRVRYDDTVIDFFPCPKGKSSHPLQPGCSWQLEDRARQRLVRVVDTANGAYAWPALCVEGWPTDVVLLSNGFRGAIAPGDELNLQVRRAKVYQPDGSHIIVDLVIDPWREVAGVDTLFDYARDARWD
jgi:hypothetical protein